MTEFEQRLTHEYGKLAEQYAQEQTQLFAQVASLGKQVRQLAEQYAREQKAHIEWASTLAEHVGKLTTNYKALTDDLTEFFR